MRFRLLLVLLIPIACTRAMVRGETVANDLGASLSVDGKTGDFYLTGKRWKVIFRGRFAEIAR